VRFLWRKHGETLRDSTEAGRGIDSTWTTPTPARHRPFRGGDPRAGRKRRARPPASLRRRRINRGKETGAAGEGVHHLRPLHCQNLSPDPFSPDPFSPRACERGLIRWLPSGSKQNHEGSHCATRGRATVRAPPCVAIPIVRPSRASSPSAPWQNCALGKEWHGFRPFLRGDSSRLRTPVRFIRRCAPH
jgi:hypothetical protein